MRPPCVTLLRIQEGETEREIERQRSKDVRYHAAVGFFQLVLAVGDRRRGAERDADLAGRPGAWSGQPERHVPRGGGVDGGYPAHTGGGGGPGLRHIFVLYILHTVDISLYYESVSVWVISHVYCLFGGQLNVDYHV